MTKKIISFTNIILPIIFFIVLQFNTMSESFVNIITFTFIIGWILPFIFPIVTGLCILLNRYPKATIFLNILNVLLSTLIIYLITLIYDKNLKLILIFYIILGILNIINIVYMIIYIYKNNEENRKTRKEESKRIKKAKKENNGIIK